MKDFLHHQKMAKDDPFSFFLPFLILVINIHHLSPAVHIQPWINAIVYIKASQYTCNPDPDLQKE